MVNYVFFRNHWIDASKLTAAMISDPTAACYCCQCSWQSLAKSLDGDPEPGRPNYKSLGDAWAKGGVAAAPHGGSGEGGSSDGALQWGLASARPGGH